MRYFLVVFPFIIAGVGIQTNSSRIPASFNPNEHFIVETTTDSTRPLETSTKAKIDSHLVHFTGAVMSDTFVLSHFSRAFRNDGYSELLQPGKYNNGSASLPKSIASTLDGIAIPPKTRLVVYNQTNLKGSKILDVTGPAIVNNSSWMSSEFYSQANKKNYRRELQEVFPQNTRRWDSGGNNSMSYWQNFSFEIIAVE